MLPDVFIPCFSAPVQHNNTGQQRSPGTTDARREDEEIHPEGSRSDQESQGQQAKTASAGRTLRRGRGGRPIPQCIWCKRKFRAFASLESHVVKEHPGKEAYWCVSCEVGQNSRQDYHKHHLSKHGTVLDGRMTTPHKARSIACQTFVCYDGQVLQSEKTLHYVYNKLSAAPLTLTEGRCVGTNTTPVPIPVVEHLPLIPDIFQRHHQCPFQVP